MGKFLEFIGLRAMTNRDALMEELDALDNGAFYKMMCENRVAVIMESYQCEDCKQRFGECPCPNGETPCRVTTEDWMDWKCSREKLISEVPA